LTQPPIETVSLLTVVVAALLGGFWQFIKKASENKTQFQQDVESIRSIIIASEILPQIVQLIEKVEAERDEGETGDIEQILSKFSFASDLKHLARSSHDIAEVENLFLGTTSLAFRCAYDLLIAAALPGATVVWLFIDRFWEYFVPLAIISTLIIFIKTTVDVLKYTRNLSQLIQKDNEIRLGRSEQ